MWRDYAAVLAVYIVAIVTAFFNIVWGGLPRVMARFLVVGSGFLRSLPYLTDRLIGPLIGGFWRTPVFPLETTLARINQLCSHLNAGRPKQRKQALSLMFSRISVSLTGETNRG